MGGIDVEPETPVLWPPDAESWLIWKDSDAGKDWRWEEKGMTEDEMVGWHHWHNGHGFGWTLEFGDGQGGLACCGSWGCKELDTTEWLNWTELNWVKPIFQEFLSIVYNIRIKAPCMKSNTSSIFQPFLFSSPIAKNLQSVQDCCTCVCLSSPW